MVGRFYFRGEILTDPNNLSADAICETAAKMKTLDKHANIVVMSYVSESILEKEVRRVAPTMFKYNPTLPTSNLFGMKVIAAPEIEGGECFFFETDKDANDFIESIRKLKSAGMTWVQIVKLFQVKIAGWK